MFTANETDHEENPSVSWIQTICREACQQGIKACSESNTLFAFIDCDFYPTKAESDTCTNFNVTCELPPEVINAVIEENHITYSVTDSSNYKVQAESSIKYRCRSGYIIDGDTDPISTCEYSGFWTTPPKCIVDEESSNVPLPIILPTVAVVLVVISIASVLIIRRAGRRYIITAYSPDFISRDREYDAFVSYNSEGVDDDFVRGDLYPKLELENDPPLKIFFHQRDFKAGTTIHANIANAIEKSNAGVVILSQDFIDSRWCIEEFDWFLGEKIKDPCFQIFVIIMQDLKTLTKCPPQLAKFINENTGLKKGDLELWTKLSKLLLDLRAHEKQEPREETTAV